MRRIKRLVCSEIFGRPTGLDFQRQKRRKTVRWQLIRVVGLTIPSALRQSEKLVSFAKISRSAAVVREAFLAFLQKGQLFT